MKKRARLAAVDLYCGVGGMSLGFEQAGFDVVAAADIEQIHVDTFLQNFPTCKARRIDLTSVSGRQFRRMTGIANKQIDVVFGGPPCQGFSLIGRRNRSDPRNLNLHHLARLIAELSASYFVVENVEGILLGDAKENLDGFVRDVKGAGYSVVDPIYVLDAAEFGVPQRRRRVFVLGYKLGLEAPLYPDPLFWFGVDGDIDAPTVWEAVGDLPRIAKYKYLLERDGYAGRLGSPSDYARVLRGDTCNQEDISRHPCRNGDGLTGCLRTVHTLKTIRRFQRTKPGSYEEVSRFHRLPKNGQARTLRAGTGPERGSYMAPRPIHPFQDRCITVREAARLHSFPDWFYFHPTKWHGFRQIGNSVPPQLARAVAVSIRRALNDLDDRSEA
jgi:DNA (cytosine-5)-methyltransferase 1